MGLPRSLGYDSSVDQFNESEGLLVINERVHIPLADLSYRYTRSSGPGGQHVNKSETAVELLFDLARAPQLSEAERGLALRRLATYVDGDGMMHLVAQSERSQLRNREEVTRRFAQLLREALVPVKKRRPTRPSRAAHERRLERKRQVGEIKRGRRRPVE
jgi:ribosome-associated protein